jgi:hypothetical protein
MDGLPQQAKLLQVLDGAVDRLKAQRSEKAFGCVPDSVSGTLLGLAR